MAQLYKQNNIPKLVSYTIMQQPTKHIEYINWCASLPKQNLEPKLLNTTRQPNIITQLQNYEMATKTPIQAFEFLIQLKKML